MWGVLQEGIYIEIPFVHCYITCYLTTCTNPLMSIDPFSDCASVWTCMRFLVFWMDAITCQLETYFHTAHTILISSLGLWSQLNLRLNQLVVMSHKRTMILHFNTHCLLFQVMQIPFISVSIIHGCPAELPFPAWSCAYSSGLWNFFVFYRQGYDLRSDFLEWKNSVAAFADCKPFCRKIMSCCKCFCEEVKCSN